jgi:hypothetical protein
MQQRVKFIFSEPLKNVIGFKNEFQMLLNNLTGYQANIDRILPHKIGKTDITSYFDYSNQNKIPELTANAFTFG